MTELPSGGAVRLFGLSLGRWTSTELMEAVRAAAVRRRSLLVTYVNAHNVNVMADDDRYKAVLNMADVLYADGMSVVWASRLLTSRPLPERVNAGDFLIPLCEACTENKLSMFLLGSESGVARKCAERLTGAAPGLRIAGATDGFWGKGGEYGTANDVVKAIRAAQPDILLVGLGVPRQELWAARHGADLGVPVIWCVGALFEYYSGTRARAPVWMRKAGLEWVFRLALEPRRLARRYLWGNLRFAGRVLREWAALRKDTERE